MFTVMTRQPCEQAGFRALSRTPAIVTLVVLLVSIVVLVTLTLIQIRHPQVLPPGLKYGVVLDAGSSRTTVYVYQWPAEKENNTGVVSQTFRCSVKGSGISSYENNPQDAPKAFEDCILKVKEQVPEHLHGSTRIYLGATAGMRLLRLQNETAAREVLESIQSYFKSQPFDFRGAQIISGQEEGVYGWITANYIMGNFLEKNLWHMWVHPHGVDTTGALDLGGASTQISFVAGEKMEPNASDTVQVSLYGYTYTLYTHSFQCYGQNEAEKKFLAMLLQSPSTEANISNPCYPQGYSTAFTLGHVFGSLCTEKQRPESYNSSKSVTFMGTGDPRLCREKVASVFDFNACQEQDACSFDGIYQPKVQGPFVAFAGFYYTASALNLSGSFSLTSFNDSSWDFCRHTWSELPALLSRFDETYARSYCFSAHYIYHLLVNGYKFTEETWPQIRFEKEVGNSSIAWSLGYMLSLTNQIPAGSPLIHLPIQPPVFMGVLAFFTAIALLCLAFLLYLCSSFRTKERSENAFDQAVDSD
ncbi:ectonucleoside triphosphate diphosphohydrolase 3 [Mus musculus]|uniref:Ectonucleoside triphosphate diphosphohydrolase 3 n=3 Tax=Mus musculus TaxID=10090 RepID=ENTP3_MOUSE|nr:ectonucleoside triphosphate diphosphohydrolase 3 [Mus musculus]Q8BFW6.1 RecName: Full=Ectonucleoside triphosphate diphosphohydrolase 3; Short=NTPDase 3; AltName: Full=Ecto-ATP diphosphohydrolase 3; Short=Ecto-ATPDase 3; Short=Ecto-ATPase 3 [Mus musculus]AAH79871.1 Ectonucleoside triphosphate diphosphohydrolase 3 [Mus musculus]AAQ86585.1 nucleoside triphosphate diphosphohydrolase-3 [Mus musculus]AAU13839.1 ectonucleoside triphosphate diphosphohydrolase 3 [Mus musculus]EDL09171.1 ectonucleosi